MPGIVGLVTSLPRQRAESELLRMVDAIKHESFYVTGTWIDETLGVYVGWAVRKGSQLEDMPFRDERRDVALVFSGEVFGEGPAAGASVLREYERDPGFVTNLNGVFHGMLLDRARGTATLFNDRYGMHRLFYHESNEAFYFGVEAKAILAVRPELRAVDLQGLGEFTSFSCVLENRTIFKGLHLLPQGSSWVFRGRSLERRHTYFKPQEWEQQEALPGEGYYQALQDVLSRNLPRYLSGAERVALALTGGLDTRVIMALGKPSAGALPCYTFGGMVRECQDVRVARRVARLCQQRHEAITVDNEFLTGFPRYAERSIYLSEGGVDISRSSDLFVSERARAIAPVKVVGTYGSEILRRAIMFKPQEPPAGLFAREFLNYVDQARMSYARVRREHPVTFAALRQSPWYHYGVLALEQSQIGVRSPFLDNDFVQLAYRAPQASVNEDVRLRLVRKGNPALGRVPTDYGVGGSPLSRHLLKFLSKAEYAYDYGMPQWFVRLDRALSPLRLERLFLGRHKLLHYRIWYRDALAPYVRDTLLASRALERPHINRKAVENIVWSHLKGDRNYTTAIHKLLSLELLHRVFFDAK